jgi:hypothetical protein
MLKSSLTSKSLTASDTNGLFSIVAKPNDILVFVAKDMKQKVNHHLKMITENNLEITLKAEELKEIFINNQPSIKLGADTKWEQGKLDQYFRKNAQRLNVVGVNRHTIDNGMDFKNWKVDWQLIKRKKTLYQIQKRALRLTL